MLGRRVLGLPRLQRLLASTDACLANCTGQILIGRSGDIAEPALPYCRQCTSQITAGPFTCEAAAAGPRLPAGLQASPMFQQARQISLGSSMQQEDSSTDSQQLNPLLQTPAPENAQLAAAGRKLPSETAQAVLHGIAISPKKLNDFAEVIRRLHVYDAVAQCRLSPKKAAKLCLKVLQSALANATNNHGMSTDLLYVDLSYVGKGTHLKRVRFHGRGRNGQMLRYRSHLTIVLREGRARRVVKTQLPLQERPRKFWPNQLPVAASAAAL